MESSCTTTLRIIRPPFKKHCAPSASAILTRVSGPFSSRSQTCRRKIFEPAFIQSFDPADVILIARVYGASHLAPAETLSPDRVAEGIRARGKRAFTFASTDEIVSFVASEARPGDHVVIMSNGGFDNIHVKLLERLRR